MKIKKQDLLGKSIAFTTYYGVISVRVKTDDGKKSLAKIELDDLVKYIDTKMKQGKFVVVEDGKNVGNTLPVIKLK